jgi:ELWxxDGT repeat protein
MDGALHQFGRLLRLEPLEERQLLSASLGDLPASTGVYLPNQCRLYDAEGYLTAPADGAPSAIAIEFARTHAVELGVAPNDLTQLKVTDCYTDFDRGLSHVYLRQMWNGLEIANANLAVNVMADGCVLSVGGGFVAGVGAAGAEDVEGRLGNSAIGARQAVSLAAAALQIAEEPAVVAVAGPAPAAHPQQLTFLAAEVSLDAIAANQHYVATADGLHLAWNLVLRTPDGEHWYNASVDAQTGQLLSADDWVDHATYTVYARPTADPDDGPRTTLTDPYDVSVSPYGWHDINGSAGAEYTDTRGNNVFAQEDTDANDSGGTRPNGGASLTFDFSINLAQAPSAYQSAAITNLFYWNNLLHDVHARYGFTEDAGNFQQINYTGQGAPGDPVQADAQDGAGTDNANFATPPDGQSPRMQMFVFTQTSPYRDGDLSSQILVHEYGHGVSNRLVGGPSNADALNAFQSAALGEGWSDWWSLMFLQTADNAQTDAYPVGTYVKGQPQNGPGIRRYPYSFDMTVDPLTYDDYNGGMAYYEAHRAGEIWCSALWDLNWLLIDKYGFDSDITAGYTGAGAAGNVLALKLVEDSLKLMPIYPTFLDGRDAILRADRLLTGGVNAKEIWTAFARRGMGVSAYDGGDANAIVVSAASDLPVLSARSALRADATPTTAATVRYTVRFNMPATGVDTSDFAVECEDISGAEVTGVSGSAATYTVSVATGSGSGRLRLKLVDDDSIVDADGSPLGGSGLGNGDFASDEWYVVRERPAAKVLDVIPNPRSEPVEVIDLVFTKPVTGVDLEDLELTRDGGSNLLTGSETLASGDGRVWVLGNLSGVTAAVGQYTLQLVAAGSDIIDAQGNALATDAHASWTNTEHAAPVAVDDTLNVGNALVFRRPAPGVLGNDRVASGCSGSAQLLSAPQHGSLTLATDGSFQYSPAAGFSGTDSFTYRVSDGTFQSSATAYLHVGSAQVVSDINALPADSNINRFTEVSGLLFFVATDDTHGTELWRTDGTADGTILLKDIDPQASSSSPQNLVNVNGMLYFSADDGTHGRELWRSDGTPEGTVLLQDLDPTGSSNPTCLTNHNGLLWFRTNTQTYVGDGTAIGTLRLRQIRYPQSPTVAGSLLFFSDLDYYGDRELWKMDGTDDRTVALVKNIRATGSSSPSQMVNLGGTLYFVANDGASGSELWKSDGTEAGTLIVKDICPGSSGSSPTNLTVVGNRLFFQATDGTSGAELWVTDGTAAGTRMARDIASGAGSSSPASLANFGGTLYFAANDPTTGTELWRSDGTAAGTTLVTDICAGTESSSPSELLPVGGQLYFAAADATHGRELWRSDGTAAGTALVKDLAAGAQGSAPSQLATAGGVLYFTAVDEASGGRLWRSDGTVGGTVPVADLRHGTGDALPASLLNAAGTLYFQATDGIHGAELWQTSGTAAGTQLVSDVYAGSGSPNISGLAYASGLVFFQATLPATGSELWKSDGTAAGTALVRDIYTGTGSSSPTQLTTFNGKIYFRATDGTSGYEMWTSDGTAAATQIVKDINPGNTASYPQGFAVVAGTLFFQASDSLGSELWKSDGTAAGTTIVKDICAGATGSTPASLTALGNTLFFRATAGTSNGYQIYRSDGTADGTTILKQIGPNALPTGLTNVNGRLFFQAAEPVSGAELWLTNGTAGGTVLVKDIYPGSSSSSPANLVNVDGTLFFTANDGTAGVELWKSDGTAAGTVLVKDILAGAGSSGVQNLTAVGSRVYFRANDGTHGTELWRSDGTAEGTVMVSDIGPGAASSDPLNLLAVGNTLYFSAIDPYAGRELWSVSDRANHAPVLDTGRAMTLAAIDEDATSNSGTLVSAILASATGDPIADDDPDALEGIAVTAVDNLHGDWQYKIGQDGTWTDFGTPSAGAARLLPSDEATWIRLVPGANWNGTLPAGIAFRAWDLTSGALGDTADTTANGGTTAFSAAIATASILVAAVNDPPVVAGLADSPDPVVAGQTVTLIATGVADPADPSGQVFSVSFYRESNGISGLQAGGGDLLIDTDSDPAAGWSVHVSTEGLAPGTYMYYALAVDDQGATSAAGLDAAATSNTVTNGVSLDVDGNGRADALTDGILILRYLFAPEGAWTYQDAVGVGATRTTRSEIKAYSDRGRTSLLDVDGNGQADALTDGILILRYLFAPGGSWSYSDAVGVGATRTSRAELKAFLDQYNPDVAASLELLAEAPSLSSAVDAALGQWGLDVDDPPT